ncbi:MAG: glycerophosphodiester phosphodiesterase family protein [Bacteroidia bacterium]|nr:glycerophosphodiester phosphodiesterase family protein [Bacteroidia bacterium]
MLTLIQRPYWLLVSLFLLVSCHRTFYLRRPEVSFFRYDASTRPAVSAHRGGGDYTGYPENCIASFQMLARQMPVIIECDIRLTQDSVLVMLHDDRLDRTTTGQDLLIETTYAALHNLRLKDNAGHITPYPIPTLAQVLRWGHNKVAFTLDVKRGVPYQHVVKLVQKTHSQRNAAIITYNAADAALVHRLDPSLMISVSLPNREAYERHRNAGVPDSVMVAFVGTRQPDPAHCAFLHEKGIRCILGTLGNLDQMAQARGDSLYLQWVQAGADILSSDRPLEAWQALGR